MVNRLLLPADLADPKAFACDDCEFTLAWSKDNTMAVLNVLAAGQSRHRLVLTIKQLDLLRQFLDANVE